MPKPKKSSALLRPLVWYLHVLISLLAVYSLFSTRFDLWLDLRLLQFGSTDATSLILPSLIKIIWAASTLLIPLTAGPRLSNLRKPTWINPGFSLQWSHYLLIPTYFILLCLLANTCYFYKLVHEQKIFLSLPIPVTLYMFLLLSLWVLLTRHWLRIAPVLPHTTPATRSTQFLAALSALPPAALGLAFFLIHMYAHPPTQTVDLAVVLGNSVFPDGTASPVLRDRTLAAVNLYHQGLAKHLLLSGAVWPSLGKGLPIRSEVTAMQQVCLDNNVPLDAISLDPVGVNTHATAHNTFAFMQAHHYTSVVACSSDTHLFRTAMAMHDYGLQPFTAPSQPNIDWQCAEPTADLRELAAIIVYSFDPHFHEPKAFAMHLTAPRLVVTKSLNRLDLFDGLTLVKSYSCITGTHPGDKQTEGDRKTPLGTFRIVFKNPQSKFHLSLGLDYPSADDAARGLKEKLITQQEYDAILAALQSDLSLPENQQKLWYTKLGGEIFIHGFAEGRTDTAGCVSVSNPDIEELYELLPINTQVEILP